MDFIKYLATGLAGSTALTGLHQMLRNNDNTPNVDLLGKQALKKMMNGSSEKYSENTLYWSTMAGDIISNSLCYSIILKAKNPVFTGLLVGTVYGICTLFLPDILGLNKSFVKSTDKKAYMTVSYYAFGGLTAGIIAKALKEKS